MKWPFDPLVNFFFSFLFLLLPPSNWINAPLHLKMRERGGYHLDWLFDQLIFPYLPLLVVKKQNNDKAKGVVIQGKRLFKLNRKKDKGGELNVSPC